MEANLVVESGLSKEVIVFPELAPGFVGPCSYSTPIKLRLQYTIFCLRQPLKSLKKYETFS